MDMNLAQLDLDQVEAQREQATRQCVVHPFSAERYFWDLGLLVFMAYTSIVLPLQFAFDITGTLLLVIDQLTNLIFIIDVVVNFLTTFHTPKLLA